MSLHYPVPNSSGDGVLFSMDFFVSLFVYVFVCLLARKTAGTICMKFSGKVRSDGGTTRFNFGSNRRNHAMRRR